MKIALISDIHGNRPALDAVLEDIEKRNTDRIICLGDIATLGTDPVYALGKVRSLNCSCILGNHDEFMIKPQLVKDYIDGPVVHDAVDWCRGKLSDEDLRFIGGLPKEIEITLEGGKKLLLYHGSPRSHMEDITMTTPHTQLEEMLGNSEADIMAGGHTHIQMLRQFRGKLIVNPGSIGFPFMALEGNTSPKVMSCAEYCTLEVQNGNVSISFHRLPLERSILMESLEKNENPLSPLLRLQYE